MAGAANAATGDADAAESGVACDVDWGAARGAAAAAVVSVSTVVAAVCGTGRTSAALDAAADATDVNSGATKGMTGEELESGPPLPHDSSLAEKEEAREVDSCLTSDAEAGGENTEPAVVGTAGAGTATLSCLTSARPAAAFCGSCCWTT